MLWLGHFAGLPVQGKRLHSTISLLGRCARVVFLFSRWNSISFIYGSTEILFCSSPPPPPPPPFFFPLLLYVIFDWPLSVSMIMIKLILHFGCPFVARLLPLPFCWKTSFAVGTLVVYSRIRFFCYVVDETATFSIVLHLPQSQKATYK